MPIDAGPCTCPDGWPQLLRHDEDGFAITIVKYHDRCVLPSQRVSAVHLPATTHTPLDGGPNRPKPDSARLGKRRLPKRTQENPPARRLLGAEAVVIFMPPPPPVSIGEGRVKSL